MSKGFIELRFGQGDLGKRLIDGKHPEDLFVQRELVPVDSIIDMYIVLPEKRNIKIRWKVGKRTFCRTEYYKDTVDCIKRWCMLKKACGITAADQLKNPVPLPMDNPEFEKWKNEKKAIEEIANYQSFKCKAAEGSKDE